MFSFDVKSLCGIHSARDVSPTDAAIRVAEQLLGVECPVWCLSSTCRLEKTESLAESRLLMLCAHTPRAPSSHAMKPVLEALSLRFLEHNMGRVF